MRGRGYVTAFNISDDGRTMAAAVCEQGQCEDCYSGPSEDASLHLRVSHNAGADWEDWGEIPQGAYISAVTAEDVAITARLPDPDGESDWDRIPRLWWHRSDEDIESPGGLDRGSLRDWRWRAGRFTWEYRGAVPVDDSGDLLPSPWDSDGLLEKGGGWYLDEVRRGGPSLWAFREENSQYFALIGAAGEVGAAFSWDDEPGRLFPSGFLTADLLVASWGCGAMALCLLPLCSSTWRVGAFIPWRVSRRPGSMAASVSGSPGPRLTSGRPGGATSTASALAGLVPAGARVAMRSPSMMGPS